MTHTPKITFDGCGLNDLHDPFRRRLFTAQIQDWEELREIGPYIETACNAHDELVAALKACLIILRSDSDMEEDYEEEINQAVKALTNAEKGV